MGTALSMYNITGDQRREIARQIGTLNICAISGGRTVGIADGIELPVSNGYLVRIQLTPTDTYTVSRVFRRKSKGIVNEFVHGKATDVYCDQVSEFAYYASCFRSHDASEWIAAAVRSAP